MFRLKLPQESLLPSAWRRVWLELIGSLVILVAINFGMMWYLGNYTSNYGFWTIHQKWWLLEYLDEPVDWLILGDSSCNQGVMPSIFENELGETAVNLCTIGNLGTVNDLWMLEEYIDRFGPPRHVLIVHVYDIWHRPLDPVLFGQVPRPWGFWNEHTFGSALFEDEAVREEAFLERFVPLYSQTRAITSILRMSLMLQHNPFKPGWHLEADGFLAATESHTDVVVNGALEHIQFVTENIFTISPTNDMAMQEIGVIADNYGFEVYLVNSPVYQGLYNNPAYQNYLNGLQQKLSEFDRDSAYVFHIPAVRTFPAELMQNPDHLILPGAEQYTHWLIEQIALLHSH
jgi:hypothetical protein